MISKEDKERNKMNIVVNSLNKLDKDIIFESKEIICPECGELCLININDYKLNLMNCKNNHENILFLEEFHKTQKINYSKIICDSCKIVNKANSYNNEFYICLTCNQNICPLCKRKHDKEHNIILYEQKNYICKIHNEKYDSYCKECKVNFCIVCEHNENHNIIYFKEMIKSKAKIEKEIKEFKIKTEKFKNVITEIINKLEAVKDNIDKYIKINEKLINNYNLRDRCYEKLYSLDTIYKYNLKIIEDINNIINEKNINNKFNNIIKIYEKMYEFKEFTIIYSINKEDKEIKLFGKNFVKENINNCKIKINNKEEQLSQYYNIDGEIDRLKIKLIIDEVKDMSYMFYGSKSLLSLPDIWKLNTENVSNMKYLFCDCSSLTELPDLSRWNTNNVTDMSFMFYGCSSLLSLPNISKWNTNNENNIQGIFDNCSSLTSFPDISKWDTNNVIDMSFLFFGCKSLLSLPDISKWNIDNVHDISGIFANCSSLKELPNISEWKTNNLNKMQGMLSNCSSLTTLPDISKWDINKVNNMKSIFYNCTSLTELPDISKWNTNSTTDISFMFYGCESLLSLPDISKWDINKVTNMKDMFKGCQSSITIPQKFKS